MNAKIITISLGVLFSFSCFSVIPKEYCISRQVIKENKLSLDERGILKYRLPTKVEWEYAVKACPPTLNFVNIVREKSEKSLNYRFPTKAEWEYAAMACPLRVTESSFGKEKSINYRLPTKAELDYAIENIIE